MNSAAVVLTASARDALREKGYSKTEYLYVPGIVIGEIEARIRVLDRASAVQRCKSLFFSTLFSGRRFPDNPGAMGRVRKTDWTRIFADQRGSGRMGPCGPILPVPLGQIPDVQHTISVFPRQSAY